MKKSDVSEPTEGRFFHYTDKLSARKIAGSKKILKSIEGTDAICGAGVYLTTMEPSCGKRAIIRNNYDGRSDRFIVQKLQEGKADVAIELFLPEEKVKTCKKERNVYVYPDDINLEEIGFESCKVHYYDANGSLTWKPLINYIFD